MSEDVQRSYATTIPSRCFEEVIVQVACPLYIQLTLVDHIRDSEVPRDSALLAVD